MNWEPLASSDPLPGDPGAIEAASSRLVGLAEALATRAGEIKAADVGARWVGLAAQRFAEHREQLPPALDAAARRCQGGAEALRRYAPELEEAQAMAAEALRRAREAEDDMAAAERGLAAIDAHARQAEAEAERRNAEHEMGDDPHQPEPWSGPDWALALSEAGAEMRAARDMLARAVDDRDEAAARAGAAIESAADDELVDSWSLAGLGALAALLGPLRGIFAGGGPEELDFVVTEAGLVLNTKESWQFEAYQAAGIDPEAWDPDRGLVAIDDEVQAAWEYYAQLFEMNPDQFLWAGMAKLAGGTFYAAFQDLHVLRVAIEEGSMSLDEAGDVLRRMFPVAPQPLMVELLREGLDDLASELRFVETIFLKMQQDIFNDLAYQHLAYQQGGLAAMEALAADGTLRGRQLQAWRDIDSGIRERVERGNLELLRYEQDRIIGDDYDRIRDRSPITWGLTMGMSYLADSPVPGGRPFREAVPYEVRIVVDTPDRWPLIPDRLVPDRIPFTDVPVPLGGGLYLDTPDQIGGTVLELPINNVSVFEKRWEWIETDMYPAYLDLVHDGRIEGFVATPIGEMAEAQRKIPDWLLAYEGGG